MADRKPAKKSSAKRAPAKRGPAKRAAPTPQPPAPDTAAPARTQVPPAPAPPPSPPPAVAPQPPAPGPRAPMTPDEERQYAMFLHISALAGLVLGGFFFLGPLIMWLIKKDESAFVDRHGRSALNFYISLVVYAVAAGVLLVLIAVVTLGLGLILLIPLIVVVGIAAAVLLILLPVLAAMKAREGQEYRYPLSIRFIHDRPAPPSWAPV